MTDATDLDAIAAALAHVRGRRPHGPGGFGPGSGPGGGGPGGAPDDADPHPRHDQRDHGSRGGHGGRGGPSGHRDLGGPWGGFGGPHARFAGGPARMRLLEALASAPHPLSVSEVGEAIGVDQPRASRLIQQAVEMGWVRREADPDDARRTRTALTDEGSRIARGFRGQRREQLQSALSEFTDDERAELARLLTKLAAAWPSA